MATPDPVLMTASPGDFVGVRVECPRHTCNWEEDHATAVVVNKYGVKDPMPKRCEFCGLGVEVVEIVEVIRNDPKPTKLRHLIAEYKPFSPYSGAVHDFDVDLFLNKIVNYPITPYMLSIIVDERWGGSYKMLERVANQISLPILAKGLSIGYDGDERAFKLGAEWTLSYGLGGEFNLVELHQHTGLKKKEWGHIHRRVLLNNRDLETGKVDKDYAKRTCEDYFDDTDLFVVVGSGYTGLDDPDIPDRADAVLIGTHLFDERSDDA